MHPLHIPEQSSDGSVIPDKIAWLPPSTPRFKSQALLSAVPGSQAGQRRERIRLTGELPSPTEPLIGCPFASRCPEVQDVCRREPPPVLVLKSEGHLAACHFR